MKFKDGENALLHALTVILDANIDEGEAVRIIHLKGGIILNYLDGVSTFTARHKNHRIIALIL